MLLCNGSCHAEAESDQCLLPLFFVYSQSANLSSDPTSCELLLGFQTIENPRPQELTALARSYPNQTSVQGKRGPRGFHLAANPPGARLSACSSVSLGLKSLVLSSYRSQGPHVQSCLRLIEAAPFPEYVAWDQKAKHPEVWRYYNAPCSILCCQCKPRDWGTITHIPRGMQKHLCRNWVTCHYPEIIEVIYNAYHCGMVLKACSPTRYYFSLPG